MKSSQAELAGGATAVEAEDRIEVLLNSPLIQQVEVVGTREGGIVDCWVPTELIDHEEVPVKKEWARDLAADMGRKADTQGGSGQSAAITFGLILGEEKLKIIDGFHRDAALLMRGEKRVYASVELSDWNSLYDSRILTAKDHAHVRFSRVVQWIKEVWEYSGLADKMAVDTALTLYQFETSGDRLGLTEEEAEQAKEWVARKETQWSMAAMTIHGHLKVADHVSPKLVNAAREKKKSAKLEAPTQAILKVFSKQLPDAFDHQDLAMQVAMKLNLSGPEVTTVCKMIADVDIETAKERVAKITQETLKPTYSDTTQRSLRRAHDARHKGAVVLQGAEFEIHNVTRRAELVKERGEEVTGVMPHNIKKTIEKADELRSALGETIFALMALLPPSEQANISSRLGLEPSAGIAHAPTPQETEEPIEIEEVDGLRPDVLAFLQGDTEIASVKPFTPKQLSACFREIDGSKSQPEGWRNRFVEIQNANNGRALG